MKLIMSASHMSDSDIPTISLVSDTQKTISILQQLPGKSSQYQKSS